MNEHVTTIYVRLLDEDVETAKIVPGQFLGGQTYKILLPDDYDPEDGEWEFLPGDIVRCEPTKWLKDEPINLAVEKVR